MAANTVNVSFLIVAILVCNCDVSEATAELKRECHGTTNVHQKLLNHIRSYCLHVYIRAVLFIINSYYVCILCMTK